MKSLSRTCEVFASIFAVASSSALVSPMFTMMIGLPARASSRWSRARSPVATIPAPAAAARSTRNAAAPDARGPVRVEIPKIDTHCHVFDPLRFPYQPDVAYRPAGGGIAPASYLRHLMDSHGIRHALLVQPNSGYGADNRCLLDAIETGGKRFKGIAIADGSCSDAGIGDEVIWGKGTMKVFDDFFAHDVLASGDFDDLESGNEGAHAVGIGRTDLEAQLDDILQALEREFFDEVVVLVVAHVQVFAVFGQHGFAPE